MFSFNFKIQKFITTKINSKMHLSTLFTTLYRRMVIIHRHQSPPHELMLILTYIYVFIRLIVTNYSLYFDVSAYFYYDIINRILFYETVLRKKYLAFFFSFIPLFSLRLLYLIYLRPDGLVAEHFYDLLVRNRNQAYLKLVATKISWLPAKLPMIWTARLKVPKSSKLLFYPSLRQKIRTKCLVIYLFFEVFATVGQLIFIFFFLLTIYNLAVRVKAAFTAAQILFVAFNVTTFAVYICFLLQTTFLTVVSLYIVCYVYTLEYSKLSRKLQKLTITGYSKYYSFARITRVTSAYRTAHTQFSIFILRFNSKTMSKIVVSYLYCIMPFHAYGIVMVYFQQRDLPTFLKLNLLLTLLFFAVVFLGICLTVTGVNKALSRSGPQLAAIFARNKADSGSTIWSREALKLATYFCMVWRSERELGFTVGQTTTMNWKLLVDVRMFVMMLR